MDILLTLTEPAGIARTNEPVTSGVPLPAGMQTSTWALFDGATQIPVQIKRLQGRAPWLLLDFQTSIAAGGTKQLTLRDVASTATPANSVVVVEDATDITVTTGPIKVLVKKAFNLFDTVWFDADTDGIYEAGEIVISPAATNIRMVDATSGNTYSVTGTPGQIIWEYQGAMRSTVRIDGQYFSGATPLLAYTTRLTFFAGSSFVKIEHKLRNSIQTNQRPVKYSSATLRIGTAVTALRAVVDKESYYSVVDSNGLNFNLLPPTIATDANGNVNVDTNGGWVLPDLCHDSRTLIVDFAQGLSAPTITSRNAMARSGLFALAPASWYSQYGELTLSNFSTLQDEKDAYTEWGWSWNVSQEPSHPHEPGYLVYWWPDVHGDTEADDTWQNVLMYLRTGSRGYWDRAQGWAWYTRNHYAYRSDGWPFAWNTSFEDPNNRVQRPLIPIALTAVDQNYSNDVLLGRVDANPWGCDHMWGWGLLDYYCLTGQLDAIEACVDLAEISRRIYTFRQPGVEGVGDRMSARNMLLVTRLYEITADPQWNTYLTHLVNLHLQAPNWDARGFYYFNSGLPPSKTLSPIHFGNLTQAFERYYNLTGNTQIRAKLVAMANWVNQYGLHATYQYAGYHVGMDYPNPGDLWHQNFDDGAFSGFDPIYTIAFIDSLVRGYRLTGNAALLDRAKHHWNRGSKGVFGNPGSRPIADNVVGRFVNNAYISSDTGPYFVANGDLSFTALIFYDYVGTPVTPGVPAPPTNLRIISTPVVTDTVSPSVPTGLSGTPVSTTQINLSWTASTDNVGVAGYHVYQSGILVTDVVSTSHSVTGLSPGTNYSFSVSAFDAAGNASAQTSSVNVSTLSGSGNNPILSALAANTWVYLNPTASMRYVPAFPTSGNPNPAPGGTLVSRKEPMGRSYSGIVYGNGKIFYWGGAHSSYPGNDVEIFDINNNIWTQSYPPEVPALNDPVYGAGGSENISPTNKPLTAHGYARTSYSEGTQQYIMTNDHNLVSFNPSTNVWTWLKGDHSGAGSWPVSDDANLSQWDSGLGGMLVFRGFSVWLWKDGVLTQRNNVNRELGSAGSGGAASVYIPDLQSHLIVNMPQGGCCGGYANGQLFMYHSINQTLTEITSVPSAIVARYYPEGNLVMAWDSIHKRVLAFSAFDENPFGNSSIDVWAYNPVANTWTQQPAAPTSPLVNGFSANSRYPIQYDPNNNAFIFVIPRVVSHPGDVETWAYKYQ